MYIAIVVFLVLLLTGMPVAFSIGLSGFTFFMVRDLPMTVLVQKSISTSQSFTMLAIPLFILAGNLMNSCGITKRLLKFCNACTGHMYGNIGQVSCLMSTLMGGVSGSAVADASMECRILGPEMTRLGYRKGWSAAINGISGLIVATIPPSMGLIIYGTVGEVSIGRLFMAGWVPGILMCVLLMLAVTWSARKYGYQPEHDTRAPFKVVIKTFFECIWAMLFPILLILLIRFGIMSPTESGAFACAYALFVGIVIYKELNWKTMMDTLRSSVKDITVITIILAGPCDPVPAHLRHVHGDHRHRPDPHPDPAARHAQRGRGRSRLRHDHDDHRHLRRHDPARRRCAVRHLRHYGLLHPGHLQRRLALLCRRGARHPVHGLLPPGRAVAAEPGIRRGRVKY